MTRYLMNAAVIPHGCPGLYSYRLATVEELIAFIAAGDGERHRVRGHLGLGGRPHRRDVPGQPRHVPLAARRRGLRDSPHDAPDQHLEASETARPGADRAGAVALRTGARVRGGTVVRWSSAG